MGTRGAVVLVAGGEEKTLYNHWDSYPSGLGESVLGWLKGLVENGTVELTRGLVRRLEAVDQTGKPTPEQLRDLDDRARVNGLTGIEAFTDLGVSTGSDWYSYLRKCQGNLDLTLASGLFADAKDFPLDSLFCEWAYVVDFDAWTFEVYQGFRQVPPTQGRWVGMLDADQAKQRKNDMYFPVERIAVFSFDNLPSDLEGVRELPDDTDADLLEDLSV